MKNIETDADIEYFRKYVNSRTKGFESIQSIKGMTVVSFLLMTALGMVFSIDSLNAANFRIYFLAIMLGGIVCSIMSDKWFHGNRGFLFLNWLGITDIGITFLTIGIGMAYDASPFLILVFVVIHIVIAILTLNSIVTRISHRQILLEDNSVSKRKYGLAGSFGFSCIFLSRLLKNDDLRSIIVAAICMALAAVLWLGVERLFQLHYAVKYNIDVLDSGESQRHSFGLREEYHCPLLRKTIEERLCTKINYENQGMLKQDKLRAVKKALKMTPDEIKQICKRCRHYQFQ